MACERALNAWNSKSKDLAKLISFKVKNKRNLRIKSRKINLKCLKIQALIINLSKQLGLTNNPDLYYKVNSKRYLILLAKYVPIVI